MTHAVGWLSVCPGQVLDAKTVKDGEDGWIFSATSYTTYDIQVTRPEGTETVITKRYSDFIDLKTKLATTEVRRGTHARSQQTLISYNRTLHPWRRVFRSTLFGLAD